MMPVPRGGAAHDDEGGDMNGRRLIVLLLAALALVAAGCGGDDSNEASGDTDTAVVEGTTTEETTEETTTTETTSTDEDISLSGKCAEFAGLSAKISEAFSGGDADLGRAAQLFHELAQQVPDEIQADVEVIADNFDQIAEVLKDVDLASGETPSAEVIAKLQQLQSPKVVQASQHIADWAKKNC